MARNPITGILITAYMAKEDETWYHRGIWMQILVEQYYAIWIISIPYQGVGESQFNSYYQLDAIPTPREQ